MEWLEMLEMLRNIFDGLKRRQVELVFNEKRCVGLLAVVCGYLRDMLLLTKWKWQAIHPYGHA